MSLTKFLLAIEKSAVGRFFENKRRLIEQLNPERIYVENIRAIFNVPMFAAKLYCEMAVIEGVFEKNIGIECPNIDCERIILSVKNKEQIPSTIVCKNCEILEREKYEFSNADVHLITYYKLVR